MSTVREDQKDTKAEIQAVKTDVNKITWAAAAGLAALQFLAPVILKFIGVH